MEIRNNEHLLKELSLGKKLKYIFFWGHQNESKAITKSCFSQWYQSPFEENGIRYLTAEHYMMYAKAVLFDDLNVAKKVLVAKTPGEAKVLGREIQGFDEELWLSHRFEIVVKGNLAKFSSDPRLAEFLLNTGNRVIVEASPVDSIWGIGLAQDNPLIETPENWQGLNLLGYALMEVRSKLK